MWSPGHWKVSSTGQDPLSSRCIVNPPVLRAELGTVLCVGHVLPPSPKRMEIFLFSKISFQMCWNFLSVGILENLVLIVKLNGNFFPTPLPWNSSAKADSRFQAFLSTGQLSGLLCWEAEAGSCSLLCGWWDFYSNCALAVTAKEKSQCWFRRCMSSPPARLDHLGTRLCSTPWTHAIPHESLLCSTTPSVCKGL